jgi:hypothetical protein
MVYIYRVLIYNVLCHQIITAVKVKMCIIVDRYGCFAKASRLRFCVYGIVHENNVEIIITPLGQKLPTAQLTQTCRNI